ncbi:MAG: ABC transporter ATP-binding protein [Methanosarcinaceae archaeon]
MIRARDFSYTYGTAEKPTLENISLEVPAGELLLVTGHSAAGKTTLALALAGILHQEIGGSFEGSVTFKGKAIGEFDGMKELSRHVGMVFDDAESQLIFTSVEEEILSGLENRGFSEAEIGRRLEEVMRLCEISHLKHRAPHTLSGGQKQKVALAATLALDTEVLILDEATSEMDTNAVKRVFSILKRLKEEEGKTIIIVDHNVEAFLEIGDRVVLLEKGRIRDVKSPKGFTASGTGPAELPAESTGKSATEAPSKQAISETHDKKPHHPPEKGRTDLHPSGANPNNHPIISVKQLSQRYDEVRALEAVDLEIYPGEFIAILGENGSGKTTLVKHFNGLLKPRSGSVSVKGLDTGQARINELVRHMGLVFQNPDNMLFEDTVEAEIAFGLNNIGAGGDREAIAHALELVGLGDKEKVFPRHLSRGERQRLAVACVIAMRPELIVLDEPTTGLDAEESDRMMQLMCRLQKEGHTIVMVTHNMQIVENYAERVIRMESGKIIEDKAKGATKGATKGAAQGTALNGTAAASVTDRIKENNTENISENNRGGMCA